jgi:hypothetical protein
MKKVFHKIKEEFVAMLPPTIFFLITLHLVAVIRVLMLTGTGIALGSHFQVTIAALILGKAVLIADLMPFITSIRISRSSITFSGKLRFIFSSLR